MLRRLLRLEVSRSYLSWFSITCLGFSLSVQFKLAHHLLAQAFLSCSVFRLTWMFDCVWPYRNSGLESCPICIFHTMLGFPRLYDFICPHQLFSLLRGSDGHRGAAENYSSDFFSLYNTSPQFHIQFQANHSQNLLIFFSSSIMCLFFEGVVSNMG